MSPADFTAAVAAYRLEALPLDVTVAPAPPLLVVGEPHGAEQTACVLWELLLCGAFDRLALEWPEDELAPIACDAALVGTLPATAESRSGDGRFAAGLFTLVSRLSLPPLLLDLSGDHGSSRTEWLLGRLEALRDPGERTLALLGAGHAAAAHARGTPTLLLDYDGGAIVHHGLQELRALELPQEIPRLRLGPARPAVVAS